MELAEFLSPTENSFSNKLRRLDSIISILIIGESGAGKTSVINDRNILFEVNPFITRTTNQIGFVKPRNKTCTTELQIVDTSGSLEDENPNGLATSNKSSVTSYLSSIQQECYREERKVFPNLILLTLKSTDTRLEEGSFGKTLKVLKSIPNAVDKRHCNLIVVVTHALALGKEAKYFKQGLQKLTADVQKIVKNTIQIHNVTVVAVENCPNSYELDWVEKFAKLPNGELSHSNLRWAILSLFKRNQDTVALNFLKDYYADSVGSENYTFSKMSLTEYNKLSHTEEIVGLRQRQFNGSTVFEGHVPPQESPDNFANSIGDNYLDFRNINQKNLQKILMLIFQCLLVTLLIVLAMLLILPKEQVSSRDFSPRVRTIFPKSEVTAIKNDTNNPTQGIHSSSGDDVRTFQESKMLPAPQPLVNLTASSYAEYYKRVNEISGNETVSLTIIGNISLDWAAQHEFVFSASIVDLTFIGDTGADGIVHILRKLPNLRSLYLKNTRNLQNKGNFSGLLVKTKLANIKSLSIDETIVSSTTLFMILENFEMPSLETFKIKQGKISQKLCNDLIIFLVNPKGLKSVSFMKTFWEVPCLNKESPRLAPVVNLTLDIMTEVQQSSDYLVNVLYQFPNLQSLQSNLGFLSSTHLSNFIYANQLKTLSINIRVPTGETTLNTLVFRHMTNLEKLLLKVYFDEVCGTTCKYIVHGYNYLAKNLQQFSVTCNYKYSKE